MQEGDTDSLGINDVARVLDRALGAPEGHLVAECSGWHVIELEHRAAADLDDEEEKRALAKAIFEQARQAAQDACSQNAECPNGKLIRL